MAGLPPAVQQLTQAVIATTSMLRPAPAESLLRDYCDFSKYERCIGDSMIGALRSWLSNPPARCASLTSVPATCAADTAGLCVPNVALVSTLSSMSPAPPFVFRNYQLPPGSEALASRISAHAGSCKHAVWQAVRASSAASFYLEDFR